MELKYATFWFEGDKTSSDASDEVRRLGLQILKDIAKPLQISNVKVDLSKPFYGTDIGKICSKDALNYDQLFLTSRMGDITLNLTVEPYDPRLSSEDIQKYRGIVVFQAEEKTVGQLVLFLDKYKNCEV